MMQSIDAVYLNITKFGIGVKESYFQKIGNYYCMANCVITDNYKLCWLK